MLIIGFTLYLITIIGISLIGHYKTQPAAPPGDADDFMLGNRSINYWLTALSAHASDMSDWLFMAFPATILVGGMVNAWIAIGLIGGMAFTWYFVAPLLRVKTEEYNAVTLASFLEKKSKDTTGIIRITHALITIAFFIIYISAGLRGIGFLVTTVFDAPYEYGVIGAGIFVALYTIIGGFKAVAWIDAFQAIFLLTALLITPLITLYSIGGWLPILTNAAQHKISLNLFNFPSALAAINTMLMAISWALPYAGMPHILTKFMGIANPAEINKSARLGLTWQSIALGAATMVGLVGIGLFANGLENPELIFITMVLQQFTPLLAGIVLCAVIAATLSTMDAQVLVAASTLAEDIVSHRTTNQRSIKMVWMLGIIGTIVSAIIMSLITTSTIQGLVYYAWMGFGAAFAPVIIVALYKKDVTPLAISSGMLAGAIIATIWNLWGHQWLATSGLELPALIPGFIANLVVTIALSWRAPQSK